ncbi:hypothetical protein SLS59_001726 [Nothophoma quercina]|uniref:Trichodiene oxygenase n=1 Tax=Nothophoma quercina TaxID=749835 RepID=A0ABR3RY57_9PLEO
MTTAQVVLPPLETSILSVRNALALAALWLAYHVLKALYNISPLHPLHNIPGPKLAAATYLPEFYYDVIKYGCYTKEISKMHEKHGQAGFGTADHDLHRVRRIPVAKFFSRGMIARLEPEIQNLAQKLCDKLLRESGQGPFDLTMAYSCFTSDAISGYSFGEPFGFLDQDGWYPNFREPLASILKPVFIFRFFPWTKASAGIGKYLVDYMPRSTAVMVRTLQIDLPEKMKKAKADIDAGIKYDRPTVFGTILESDVVSLDKEPQRLADEAAGVIGAGTETTSWAMAVITYHLLTKPELLNKLRNELQAVVKDPKQLPAWTELENLPYLGAVIQEGLRLSYGVSARTARVPTEENLVFRGEWNKRSVEYVIPQGYAVGMSAAITHHDEKAFPDSYAFAPERWLDENNQRRKDVERSMLAFSKGSRSCLGMK